MKNLVEESCTEFAALLASKTSVPGGGGAAALTGALGIALCSMVGNFTVGKKKYASVEADIQAILQRADLLRQQLLALVDADAQAFAPLSQAYAIPRDDPTRAQVLETATANACQAPLEMLRRCGEAMDLLAEMLEKGSAMLLSDVGCGTLLCRAAMESAAMNVFVNTTSLRDRALARSMEAEVDELLERYVPQAESIAETVKRGLRKEVP